MTRDKCAAQQGQKVRPHCGVSGVELPVRALHCGIGQGQGGQRQHGHAHGFGAYGQTAAGRDHGQGAVGEVAGVALRQQHQPKGQEGQAQKQGQQDAQQKAYGARAEQHGDLAP